MLPDFLRQFRDERSEDVAGVTSSLKIGRLLLLFLLPLPRVTRGRMIYRRTVVAAYKTVIMFYHPGQSTETATAGSRNLGATTPRAYNE